jgi:hypothetical protein
MAKSSSRRPVARSVPVPQPASRLPWVAAVVILVTAAVLYGFTLPFPMVFDDDIYLVKNPLVQDAKNFGYFKHFTAFVTNPEVRAIDPDLTVNFVLRPVTYLTFYANFAQAGFDPRGFRLVNIVIHAANALLLFGFLRLLLRASPKAAHLTPGSAGLISLATALVFLVHPLQTESVTFIVQRFTSLATCFYLLTLLTHLRARQARSPGAARAWRVASVVALVTGMFAKENVFTAPVMLVLIDYLVMGDSLKIASRRALPQLLCLPIIPLMLLLISYAQGQAAQSTGRVLNIVNYNQDSPLNYALSQLSVIVTYLRLMLVPKGLNLDPDFPVSTSFWQPRVLLSFTLLAGLLAGTWWWYRRRQNEVRAALICCGVIWFFVGLGIESSVVPLPDLMAEHRSYLSTIGVFLALVCAVDLLRTRYAGRSWINPVVGAGLALWVVSLGVATIYRNNTWRSDISIWENSVANSPRKARPWFNLAGAYFSHGRLPDAAEATRKVIALEPRWVDAYINLGTIENHLGQHEAALATSQRGLKLAPKRCELYYGKALAYARLRQYPECVAAAHEVLALKPTYRKAHLLLGDVFTATQQFEKALGSYRQAGILQPLEPSVLKTVTAIETLLAQRPGGP